MKRYLKLFLFILLIPLNSYANDKILIFWYGMGMGHMIPAKRIAQHAEEYFKKKGKKVETKLVDIREFSIYDDNSEETGKEKYLNWATKESEAYNKFFKWHLEKSPDDIKTNFNLYTISKYLAKEKPTAIVTVFWGAAHVFYLLKNLYPGKLDLPVALLYTDYGVRKFAYMVPKVNQIFMPTKGLYEEVFKKYKDLAPYQSYFDFSGIPVAQDIISKLNNLGSEKIRKELKLRTDATTVALARGGEAFIPLAELIRQTQQRLKGTNYQILALSGGATIDAAELKAIADKDDRVVIVNRVPNELYMKYIKASDILVTKPGGVTLTETSLLNIPMVIMKGLGGQEQDNTDEYVKNGLAFYEEQPKRIVDRIEQLVKNDQIRNQMKDKQKKYFNGYDPGKISAWLFQSKSDVDWNQFSSAIEKKETKVAMQKRFDLSAISLKNWYNYLTDIAESGSKSRNAAANDPYQGDELKAAFSKVATTYMQKSLSITRKKNEKYLSRIENFYKNPKDYSGPDIFETQWKFLRNMILEYSFHVNLNRPYDPPSRALLDKVFKSLLKYGETNVINLKLEAWEYTTANLYRYMANFFYLARDYKQATEYIDKSFKLADPKNFNETMIQLMAEIYMKNNRAKDAINHLREHLKISPKMEGIRVTLAQILEQEGREEESIKEIQHLEKNKVLTEGEFFRMAALYLRMNKKDEAFNLLKRGITQRKGSVFLHSLFLKTILNKENRDLMQKVSPQEFNKIKNDYKQLKETKLQEIERLPILVEDAL